MEEGDQLVLRVTIGVSLTFPPLLIESNQGWFLFFYSCFLCSCFLLLFLSGMLSSLNIDACP